MARGWPAFWTTLIALPFLVGGAYAYFYRPEYPTSVGTLPMFFAGFMILLGLYVHVLIAPDPPMMQPGETLHVVVSPFSLAAVNLFAMFLTFFVVTVFLRFKTPLPVIVPAITMVVTLYFLVKGLVRYWKASLTVHYVTNRRIITDYRFLWVTRIEVPLPSINGLKQRKTIMESLLGIGNIVLVTGSGGRRPARIEMHDIRNAMQIRKVIAQLRFAHDGEVDDPGELGGDGRFDPVIDVASDRIEAAARAMMGLDDAESECSNEDRPYLVDADLDISLSAQVGGDSDDGSNADKAKTLVKTAATQAAALGAAGSMANPASVIGGVSAGSAAGAALASTIGNAVGEHGGIASSVDATASTAAITQAASTAANLGSKVMAADSGGLVDRLRTGSQHGSAVAGLLADQLDDGPGLDSTGVDGAAGADNAVDDSTDPHSVDTHSKRAVRTIIDELDS